MSKRLIVALSLSVPSIAHAQTDGGDVVSSMTRCRSIAEPAARLACFDQAAAAVETAREKKELVVLDKAEVKKTRRTLFGFSLPRIKFLEGEDDPEPQIETTVDWARSLGNGKWALKTKEGATWQTTEAMIDAPRTGDKLTIRRGTLGSYFIKIGSFKAVRAMRTG